MNNLALKGHHVNGIFCDGDDLVLPQCQRFLGIRNECSNIRPQEVFSLPHTDHERRVAPGPHNNARGILVNNQQSESTLQPRDNLHHCLGEIPRLAIRETQEHGCHFRIGVAKESFPRGNQFFLELVKVFDDPVVDQGEFSVISEMGVGIGISRRAMRGPPGVSNPRAASLERAIG